MRWFIVERNDPDADRVRSVGQEPDRFRHMLSQLSPAEHFLGKEGVVRAKLTDSSKLL